jgi:hypothetical protein
LLVAPVHLQDVGVMGELVVPRRSCLPRLLRGPTVLTASDFKPHGRNLRADAGVVCPRLVPVGGLLVV